MKKTYSIYIDDILIKKLKKENPNFKMSKLIELSIVHYLESQQNSDSKSKLSFEMSATYEQVKTLTAENESLKETLKTLGKNINSQEKLLIKQNERMEEIFNYQNEDAQQNYDSLIEQFRNFARINNNFNEKELYYLNYLILPLYKEISTYEDMPNYSLTDIYASEDPLIAIGARIKNEMAKDKENRRKAKNI
ncbi:hypothetical protein [Enterococcus alishanensis]